MTALAVNRETVPWWVVLLQGLAAIVIGFFLMTNTAATTVFLVQVLGWYWLITGLISIVMIFVDSTGWGWKLLIGILGVVAGLYIVRNPLQGTLVTLSTFVLLVAIQGIIIGIINLIQAFQGAGWGAGLLGVISIIFGVILLGEPFLAALGLPWVLGIFAIVGGIFAVIAAFRLRSQ